ncbi:MAG: DUF3501 family protein [Chloroflexi bacterium]|nr:DUF3501 family protein [Chloroflexota bacterium]MCH7655711.1 DUF3501 family protein [Chloroflexota bacterium]
MRPVAVDEILDIAAYESVRPEARSRIIALKRNRRVGVGDLVTLVFENRDTVLFQVQEMIRAERMVAPERIQEELDTYNQLIPRANQLSATLLIEITDKEGLREILDRFIGIDRGGTTFLSIGGERVEGEYEGGRSNEVRISAVHYVTFDLSRSQTAAFIAGDVPVSLLIEHPAYRAEAVISGGVRASLAEDLAEA